MKHNQFKAIINKLLKDKCQEQGLTLSGVDVTNNQKYIYIYDKEWNCKLAVSLWINDTQIHLSATTNTSKPVGLANRTHDITCSYLEFNKIYRLIDEMFNNIKETK